MIQNRFQLRRADLRKRAHRRGGSLRARRCTFPSRPWSTTCRIYTRSARTPRRSGSRGVRETVRCFSSGAHRPPRPGSRCRHRDSEHSARAAPPRARRTAAYRCPGAAGPRAGKCSSPPPRHRQRGCRTARRRHSRRARRRAPRPDTDTGGAWRACARQIPRHPARCTRT